ncbi:hypothetical protein D3C73_1536040 [compost metagenome]
MFIAIIAPIRYTLPNPKSVPAKLMFSTIHDPFASPMLGAFSLTVEDTIINVGAPYSGLAFGLP